MKIYFYTWILLFITSPTSAQSFFINPKIYWAKATLKNSSSDVVSDYKEFNAHLSLAYSFASGLNIGIQYDYLSQNTDKNRIFGLTNKLTDAYLFLGIEADGLLAHISLLNLITPIWQIESDQTVTEYKKGSQLSMDLAYHFNAGFCQLGPGINWTNYTFKQLFQNRIEDTNFEKVTFAVINPYLSLVFYF